MKLTLTDAHRLARSIRVKEAAARGIQIVPKDPDPAEFPFVQYACRQDPPPCLHCNSPHCGGIE